MSCFGRQLGVQPALMTSTAAQALALEAKVVDLTEGKSTARQSSRSIGGIRNVRPQIGKKYYKQ
eukprot:2397075-Amphidinium_carterae.2